MRLTLQSRRRPLASTRGGRAHSSTYGRQKAGPLPRLVTVASYARSRAMRIFLVRKNLRMPESCWPMKKSAASVGGHEPDGGGLNGGGTYRSGR
jgi:hypothetical protein